MVAYTTKPRQRRRSVGAPGASEAPRGDDAARLRASLQGFVRAFGLLAGDQTPCGKPLSLSYAHALLVLLDASEPPTQQQLGRALRIDKSNVARLCARMEAAGHLTQRRSADDGRRRLLALTARGRRLAEQVDQASRERFTRLLAALPGPLRPSIFDALDALLAAASTLDKEPP